MTELSVCSFPLITRTASDSKLSAELEFATPLEFPNPTALFRVPEPAKMARMISLVHYTRQLESTNSSLRVEEPAKMPRIVSVDHFTYMSSLDHYSVSG